MINYILAAETAESFGERTVTALMDSLLGMIVIFAVLILLWIVIEVFHACVSAVTKKKAPKEVSAPVVDAPVADAVDVTDEEEDEAAIVAAITAAISVCMEKPVGSFRVVSFKKSGNNAHWNRK